MRVLQDKALELSTLAAELSGRLAPVVRTVLKFHHMEVINSYYSNLIEGHNTEPIEVRAAQRWDYSEYQYKRNLQLESLAHISTQRYLWEHGDALPYQQQATLLKIHELFFNDLPPEMLVVTGNEQKVEVVPGKLRESDVKVGHHIPPSFGELGGYLDAFAEAYDVNKHGGSDKILAVMAAHHRLVWIHPFIDGNGRVTRLHTGLGFCDRRVSKPSVFWCLSRGLAKRVNVGGASLQEADADRRGDSDGRGARSESALIAFIDFMLDTALDQVRYIGDLLKPDGMRQRIESYVTHRNTGVAARGLPSLRKEATQVLQQAFLMGKIQRQDMAQISGLPLPSARKLFQQLKEEGLLTETSSRSPLCWAIPDHAEPWYFPDLSAPAAKALEEIR